MHILKIEIITRIERNKALQLLMDGIQSCEGWIVNHQLFSNMSASIIFEIPSDEICKFYEKLQSSGFNINADENFVGKTSDVRGSIAITFIHEEPDLKRDVPAFG